MRESLCQSRATWEWGGGRINYEDVMHVMTKYDAYETTKQCVLGINSSHTYDACEKQIRRIRDIHTMNMRHKHGVGDITYDARATSVGGSVGDAGEMRERATLTSSPAKYCQLSGPSASGGVMVITARTSSVRGCTHTLVSALPVWKTQWRRPYRSTPSSSARPLTTPSCSRRLVRSSSSACKANVSGGLGLGVV